MKNEMKAMIVLGTLIVLVSSSIAGCGKSKEEKEKAEQNRRETSTTEREETAQNSKERSNSNSTAKKEAINFFEEKEVSRPEKVPPTLSAGEVVKRFYAAVNEKDYTKAQNCVSSRFLNSLKSHPVSKSQGIEKALDAIAARDILKEITIIDERKSSISASQAKGLGLRELEKKGGEIYDVRYELIFKSPFDKLTRRKIRTESLIIEGDSYKIIRLPDEVLERSNVNGIQTFVGDNLSARFLEYRVVDFSESPSSQEGWTNYVFTISLKNTSSEMLKIELANLHAIVSEQQVCNAGSAFTPLPQSVSIAQRKYLPSRRAPEGYVLPGYSIIYGSDIQVPTLADQVDFYILTPDFRSLSVSTKSPFSQLSKFPPKNRNEMTLGETFVVKDLLEFTPLGLELIGKPERKIGQKMLGERLLEQRENFRLWFKIKNLTLENMLFANFTIYFRLFDEEGYTKDISSSLVKTIVPPLFEKIRFLGNWKYSNTKIDIEKGKNYALLVGIKPIIGSVQVGEGGISAPMIDKKEPKKLLAYKVYRFEGQPTHELGVPQVTIDTVKVNWGYSEGLYLQEASFVIRNSGMLPVYIEKTKFTSERMGERDVEKWVEPSQEILVNIPRFMFATPQEKKPLNLEIQAINVSGEIIASYFLGQIGQTPRLHPCRIQRIKVDYSGPGQDRYVGRITYLTENERPVTFELPTIEGQQIWVLDPSPNRAHQYAHLYIPLEKIRKAEFETIPHKEVQAWPQRFFGKIPKIKVEVEYRSGEIVTYEDHVTSSYLFPVVIPPVSTPTGEKQATQESGEQHSNKQELVDTLEDLERAIIKKIQLEVDITTQCFTSVKEYRRAKLLADVLRPVLRVIQGTISVLSKIGDATTLSGQVKTSLDNAQYVSEAASLFFMVNGLRESGERLYYAIDDTSVYVRTVKDMLQAADQTTVIRMDPRAYKQVIKQYLDSEQGTPLIIARTSELAPDKKPAKGALVLYKTIREEFRTLIEQIQRSEIPPEFPINYVVDEIEQLKQHIIEAGVHNIDVHYSIYHQGLKVHQSRKLGAVAEHNKAFAQVAGALAKRLDIEIYAECAQLAATGADAAYIVTYKVPGAGEAVKMTQQVSLLPQIVIEGKKMFTVDPEEQFYQMPQEMLFSLAIEFSSLLRIADDTVLSLTKLLKETSSQVPPSEVQPTPTSTKQKEPAKQIEKQVEKAVKSLFQELLRKKR